MRAIEYECDDRVSIRLCKEATFPWGTKPDYWYLRRPIFTMDAPEIGWDREAIKACKDNGFDVAYWNGKRWFHHSPKQFDTPEEAFAEYQEKIKAK
jgi:hypothetical protein